jgi:Kef-type K+ transport system membrane component KefB
VLALLGLILGLLGLPIGIVIPFLGAFYFVTDRASSAVVGATLGVGLLLPIVGLVLSWRALRALAAKPHLAGRVLALTGVVAASVSALWCAALGVMLAFKR